MIIKVYNGSWSGYQSLCIAPMRIKLQKVLKIKVVIWYFKNLTSFLQLVFANTLSIISSHTDTAEPWCLLFMCIHLQWAVLTSRHFVHMLFCSYWSLPFVLVLYKELVLLYSLCTVVYNSTFPDECMMNN